MKFALANALSAILLLALAACASEKAKEEKDSSSSKDTKTTEESPTEDDGGDPFAKHEDLLSKIGDKAPVAGKRPTSDTGGSGGEVGKVTSTFTSSEGVSADYYLNVPADAGEKAYRLFVHFHGDGGAGLSRDLVDEVAEGLDVIGVAVAAPDGHSWWSNNGQKHLRFIREFIEEFLHAKYNVSRKELIVSGVSGGATFIAGLLLPDAAYLHAFKAFALCGGAPNLLEAFQWSDGTDNVTYIHFYRNKDDFLEPQISKGIAYYQDLGVNVKETIHEAGSGHCNFDAAKVVLDEYRKTFPVNEG